MLKIEKGLLDRGVNTPIRAMTEQETMEQRIKIQAADLARKNKELQSRLDELERQRKAAEDAITRTNKDGGMTDETVKVIRQALGMKVD